MPLSEPGPPLLFAFYRRSLLLYPRRFRDRYGEQMIQTIRDAYRERRSGLLRFWWSMYRDLLQSLCVEQMLMFREQSFQRPIFWHAFMLGLIITVLGGAAAVTVQQMLRRGADQPQMQMADLYVSRLLSGGKLADLLPSERVDLAQSLEPFAIVYDEAGKPENSTGSLDGIIPTPPSGVFHYLRVHGNDHFTWQPRPGVRIAAVARRITRPRPGFLLVGRSLRSVEENDGLLRQMTFGGWFVLMLLLIAGAAFLRRAGDSKTMATS